MMSFTILFCKLFLSPRQAEPLDLSDDRCLSLFSDCKGTTIFSFGNEYFIFFSKRNDMYLTFYILHISNSDWCFLIYTNLHIF